MTPTGVLAEAEAGPSAARWHCGSWGSDNVVDGTETVSDTVPACAGRDRVLLDVLFPPGAGMA